MKIGIVARGPTAVSAPFHDLSWTLWGLPWIQYPRIDAVFEIHEQAHWDQLSDPETALDCNPDADVYCTASRAARFDADRVRPYPFDEVLSAFPGAPFESTICYQMSFALLHGASEIGLWGCDMPMTREEYIWQRGAVLYWIGRAEEGGVKVTLAPGSPLMMSRWNAGRYGVSGEKRFD